jgi:hypothetical protein
MMEGNSPLRHLNIKRQAEIPEHCLGSLKDLALAHSGVLAHLIHGPETTTDEVNGFQRTEADLDLALASHLQCVQGIEATHHHQHEALGVQIAEIKPVGPSLPKLLVGRVLKLPWSVIWAIERPSNCTPIVTVVPALARFLKA